MNLDATIRIAAPEPARNNRAGSAPQRAAGDTPAHAAGAGSFLSMLQALTGPAGGEAASPGVGDAALPGVDSALPAGVPVQDGATEPEDASSDGLLRLPQETVAPVQPAIVAAADAAVAEPRAAERPNAARQTARAPGAVALAAADGRTDGSAAAVSAPEPAQQQALHAASDAAALQAGARKADAAAQGAGAAGRQQLADAADAADAAASARGGLSARADGIAQAREAMQVAPLPPLASTPAGAGVAAAVSMFEAGLAGLRAGPGGRAHERGAARGPSASDATQAGFVAWSDPAPSNQGTQPASPVYAPTASTPVPSAALAQRLHYWVAGGVQSAELQLDAFGGGAVDVHIAVKGEEAFVEFRSDQPQARRLLLDAMPQLKELLAGEGLLLSGGFVGGSAQQPSDGGGTRPERFAAARGAASVRAATVVTAAPAPVRGVSGAAIDLFV